MIGIILHRSLVSSRICFMFAIVLMSWRQGILNFLVYVFQEPVQVEMKKDLIKIRNWFCSESEPILRQHPSNSVDSIDSSIFRSGAEYPTSEDAMADKGMYMSHASTVVTRTSLHVEKGPSGRDNASEEHLDFGEYMRCSISDLFAVGTEVEAKH